MKVTDDLNQSSGGIFNTNSGTSGGPGHIIFLYFVLDFLIFLYLLLNK